ncbi:hypothetical protein Tsubulata_028144, partial [Turnera subulata]
KPFTFGHPSEETLASRFLGQDPPPSGRPNPLVEAQRKERISELNQQLNQTIARLEAEKQRGKVPKQLRSKQEGKGWWDANLDDLNVQELHQLLSRFENVYQHLCSNVKENRTGRLGNSSSISDAANEAGPSSAAAANEAGPSLLLLLLLPTVAFFFPGVAAHLGGRRRGVSRQGRLQHGTPATKAEAARDGASMATEWSKGRHDCRRWWKSLAAAEIAVELGTASSGGGAVTDSEKAMQPVATQQRATAVAGRRRCVSVLQIGTASSSPVGLHGTASCSRDGRRRGGWHRRLGLVARLRRCLGGRGGSRVVVARWKEEKGEEEGRKRRDGWKMEAGKKEEKRI